MLDGVEFGVYSGHIRGGRQFGWQLGGFLGLLRGFFLSVFFLGSVFIFNTSLAAQDATGRVIGTVYDQQGGIVPAANVTVTNVATKIAQSTVTGKDGYFEVLDLPIGNYRVAVEHAGFNKVVTQAEKLLINQSLRFDITLTVGTSNQTVTVEAQVSGVETENPTLGQSRKTS